jgi:signal transduction histidine kinase
VKGAGVGLSITRSIVESHGGNIWVDAAVPPSAGTSMVIVLPLNRRS